jgi:hypothetical protein
LSAAPALLIVHPSVSVEEGGREAHQHGWDGVHRSGVRAVSGIVLAVTFIAIYRQLSIARSANAFEQLNRISDEFGSERSPVPSSTSSSRSSGGGAELLHPPPTAG